jgi:hypothetical protein
MGQPREIVLTYTTCRFTKPYRALRKELVFSLSHSPIELKPFQASA